MLVGSEVAPFGPPSNPTYTWSSTPYVCTVVGASGKHALHVDLVGVSGVEGVRAVERHAAGEVSAGGLKAMPSHSGKDAGRIAVQLDDLAHVSQQVALGGGPSSGWPGTRLDVRVKMSPTVLMSSSNVI